VGLGVAEYYHPLFAVIKDGVQTIDLQQLIEIALIDIDMRLDKSTLGGFQ
jgi:hypothetical protein